MTKILYLHGFASSADSTKANLIKSFVKKNTETTSILIPNLENNIKNAYAQISEIIKKVTDKTKETVKKALVSAKLLS